MIVLQVGRLNIESNCDWGVRGDVPGPGETAAVLVVAQRTAALLTARGLQVQLADANWSCLDVAKHDYEAVLTLQAGALGIATETHETTEVADLVQLLAAEVVNACSHAGLGTMTARVGGAAEHYMARAHSPKTPWVLVELGPAGSVVAQADVMVQALYAAVLGYFHLPLVQPDPEWKQNLQPHELALVLNREVQLVDLSNGMRTPAGVSGSLNVKYTTTVADVVYYVTASGAAGGLGLVKTDVDAAAGLTTITSPPQQPAPAAAPPAPASAAQEAAQAPGPAPAAADTAQAGPAPATAATELPGRLRRLADQLHGLVDELEGSTG